MGLPKSSKGALFVGAGDSYAVAMAAFYFSRGGAVALDPYALASFPEFAVGREVYFVSVSGRTSSNVLAAARVRSIAKETIAITADGQSRLARATTRTVEVPFVVTPRSPGLLSFCLTLLAVLKLVGAGFNGDLRKAMHYAEKDSEDVSFGRGTTYFLGNGPAYAASLYAAAKVYEVLGRKAQAQQIEEFSHMELFSLKKSDSTNAFACFDPARIGRKFTREASRRGFDSRLIASRGRQEVERLFHSVFVAQLAVLRRARSEGIRGPRFLYEADKLGMSDSMIY